jgi:hypothetical protein
VTVFACCLVVPDASDRIVQATQSRPGPARHESLAPKAFKGKGRALAAPGRRRGRRSVISAIEGKALVASPHTF